MTPGALRLCAGVLLVASATLVACNGDDDANGTPTSTPGATSTATSGGGSPSPTATGTADATASPTGTPASSTGAEAEIEESIRAMNDAENAGDIEAFLGYWTDEGLASVLRTTRDEMAAQEGGPGGDPAEIRALENISVDGDTATADLERQVGISVSGTRLSLLREDDVWKIDGGEPIEVEVPADYTTIDVELDEFAFGFDTEALQTGNVAFNVDNVGEQPHELVLLRVPADMNLEEALASEEEPEGIEFLAFTDLEGGASRNLLLTEPLTAGRYVMICFFPDTDDPAGTPHAFKGMVSDVTIE